MRTAVLGSATEPPRAAFSVGRSVGNAVTRNRVRRQLRAALREHEAFLEPGGGYLVRAIPGAAGAPYIELSGTLSVILGDMSGGRP